MKESLWPTLKYWGPSWVGQKPQEAIIGGPKIINYEGGMKTFVGNKGSIFAI